MKRSDSTTPSGISVSLHHIRHASTENLERAARHYKRTLAVLRAGSFEQLPDATLQKLTTQLADGLDAVEGELRRRGSERPILPSSPRAWSDDARMRGRSASRHEPDDGFTPMPPDYRTEDGRTEGNPVSATRAVEEKTQ